MLKVTNEQVTPAKPHIIDSLLADYDDVFGELHCLPLSRSLEHQINLIPNAKPFKLALYRYSHVKKLEIEK